MDRLPGNASRFDRHAEVEPEFEQKLIEHILLGSTLDEMLRVLQEAVLYVIWSNCSPPLGKIALDTVTAESIHEGG
jgi:hypothetical protein